MKRALSRGLVALLVCFAVSLAQVRHDRVRGTVSITLSSQAHAGLLDNPIG